MSRSPSASRSLSSPSRAPWYPDDLLPQLQATLAALADLEVRYETDREHLQTWDGPEAAKRTLAAQLDERHERDRGPYVQRLADLHGWLTGTMALDDICLNP